MTVIATEAGKFFFIRLYTARWVENYKIPLTTYQDSKIFTLIMPSARRVKGFRITTGNRTPITRMKILCPDR